MDQMKVEDAVFKKAMEFFKDYAVSFFGIDVVVIYSADIKDVVTFVDMGTIKYEVQAFYMKNLNGDEKLMQLEGKILNKERLFPEDMLNLSFIPLMKSNENKSLRTLRSIELADRIENNEDKTQCLTLLFALLEKFGDEEAKKKFKEVFSMTEIGKMIREDGIKEGMKEGIKEGKKEGKTDILIKLLIKKFDKLSDEHKIKLRSLSEETIDIMTIDIFEMKDIREIEKYFY